MENKAHALAAGIFLIVVTALLAALAAQAVDVAVGAVEAANSGESSMILGWPLWWSYLTLGPGFLLLSLTGLYTAWKGSMHNEVGEQ